jgi:nucleoside-diphosphate-sugar epimerase/putative sterol carrier protein
MLAETPPDLLLHCAGLTRFEQHLAGTIQRHNLDGTRHAHVLAARLGIARFHFLSTAFIAGDSERPFGPDERDCGQDFNNPYEASKYAAEAYLEAGVTRGGPAITVCRPSIVVGGSALGDTHAVSTVYTFIKALHFLRACCLRDSRRARPRLSDAGFAAQGGRCHIPLRIEADATVTLDLVDMEDVVDGIMRTLGSQSRYEVRHLTGRPTTLAALRDGICAALGVEGPRLVAPDAESRVSRTRLERQFERLTHVYRPYLGRTARFVPPADYHPRVVDPLAFARDFVRELDNTQASSTPRGVGALALAVAGVQEPSDYFAALADGRVGRLFLARNDFVDLRAEFRIRGVHACRAHLHISRGRARVVTGPGTPSSDCAYVLDDELFMRVISGQTDLRAAFFAGRVRIEGNLELALKFGALLGLYFRDIDEHVLEEIAL